MSRGGDPAVFLTRQHDEEDPFSQFLGDIAFLLELGLVSAGLVLLHTGRERSARLLRAAGWLLIVGATTAAVCTGYFWLRYHREDRAFKLRSCSTSAYGRYGES